MYKFFWNEFGTLQSYRWIGGEDVQMQDFEKIYAEYFSDVYRYALSLSQNESVAEEITQETFFKALHEFRLENKIITKTRACLIL